MIFAVAIGILSALVVLIAMSRIDLKKFMGYPAVMDVLVTVVLIWMLHGSYVGMVAAVMGGLFFTVIITATRKMYGWKRLELVGYKLQWVEYNGEWYERIKSRINNERETRCLNLRSPKLLIGSIVGLFVLASIL